jgi:UDP-glucose 4-epimerase
MTTIWITGGKGFIGRHLARLISGRGNRVFGIGHGLWPAEEAGKWGYANWCNGEIEAANLSQLAQVSGLPDIVYHLAGGSSVGASFQNPYEDFCRSVESTSRLLEWLRLSAPDVRIVSVSSAAVYGAGHAEAIAESTVISPYSPYGAFLRGKFRAAHCDCPPVFGVWRGAGKAAHLGFMLQAGIRQGKPGGAGRHGP